MRIGHSGSGVRRIGHDSKVGCVLMTNRRDFIPMDRSAFSQKLVNHGSAWQMDGRKYDGVDNYIDSGNAASLNITGDGTYSIWYKPFVITAVTQGILGTLEGKNDYTAPIQLVVYQNTGVSRVWIGNGTAQIQVADTIMASTVNWNQILITISGTIIFLYRNRNIVNTGIFTGIRQNLNKLTIGSSSTNNRFFNGTIKEVRIYNRAEYTAKISRQTFRRKAGIGG